MTRIITIAVLLLSVACTRDSVTQTPSSRAECAALDRAECLSSTGCTMVWVETSVYQCRPAEGVCETGLKQTDTSGCEGRDGCTWEPGECYCPFPGYGRTQVEDKGKRGGGACACGGGRPPICKAT